MARKSRMLAIVLAVWMTMSFSCNVWFGRAAAVEGESVLQATLYDLQVNGRKEPVTIDPGAVEFSWKIRTDMRGYLQSAYQILLTDQRTGIWIWDSEKVVSSASAGVPYTGPVLEHDTPYCWQVRVWDTAGGCTDYSDIAVFRVGLATEDWTADYIWDGTENPNNFAYFRQGFRIRKAVAEAVVYVSAHNDYQLWLDGNLLGAGPARSDPYTYGQYCTYDITEALQQGSHAFASLAHWHGVWSDSGVNAAPAFLLEARIRFTDGSTMTIKTDDTWKMLDATPYLEQDPVYFGHYGGVNNRASIRYDARLEIPAWNNTAFDDNSWKNAVIVDRAAYQLFAQDVEAETEAQARTPLTVIREGDRWLVDFGQCLTGWPKLHLTDTEPGQEVRVQYWEVGKNWGDAGYDTYFCAGGNETVYQPYVRHTSFRLLEISGYDGPLTVADVQGMVAYSYAETTGSFVCSDPRLNAVYEMSLGSAVQNIQQGIVSVDANREQSPWTADSWNVGMGILYNQEDTRLLEKVIRDYAGEQQENGNFLTCSPARDYLSQMAEWSMYWPMLLWEEYCSSGSTALLQDMYPHLISFLNYMEQYRIPGTGLYNPPGWRASDYAGGSLENGGENIATNCQYYMNLCLAARIAQRLEDSELALVCQAAADRLKSAINRVLLRDGEAYATTAGSSQLHPLGTAWALRADVVPAAFRERVIQWLATQYTLTGYDVGGYGGDALYNGLYSAGLGEIAAADFARYDNMLQTNCTNWESFGSLSIDNMGNHAWTAYPAYLLQRYVGGISARDGGYAALEIKPAIEGLTEASATVPTVKGQVSSAFQVVSAEKLVLSVTIPANSKATVYLPDQDMKQITITESGLPVYADDTFLPGVDGIWIGWRTEDAVVLELGSGQYTFTLSGQALQSPAPGEITRYVLDDNDALFQGDWYRDTVNNVASRYGDSITYILGVGQSNATATAVYTQQVEQTGSYSIYARWPAESNRATNAPYTVSCGDFTTTVRVNQEQNDAAWNLLTTLDVQAGDTITVTLTNDADEYVIADAIMICTAGQQTLTSLQQLQLLVYEMELAEVSGCTDGAKRFAFREALSEAQTLCAGVDTAEDAAAAAARKLEESYQAAMACLLPNLALAKSVTVSEGLAVGGFWGGEYLTDGYLAVDNSGRIGYSSADYSQQKLESPITLTVDLEEIKTISQVALYPRVSAVAWTGGTANFPADYILSVSTDGVTFTPVYSVTDQPDPQFEKVLCSFAPVAARYVQLQVTRLGEYAADEQVDNRTPYRLQLSELAVYHPDPDVVAARVVEDQIDALPSAHEITGRQADAVAAARAAYEALSQQQQAIVYNLDWLAAAEAALSQLAVGLPGDLSGDGILSVTDVILLRKAILSGASNPATLAGGDLNQDAVLSVTDVVLLRKAILNS